MEYTLGWYIKPKRLFGLIDFGVVNRDEVGCGKGVIAFDFPKERVVIRSGTSMETIGVIVDSNRKTCPFIGIVSADGYKVFFSKEYLELSIRIEEEGGKQGWETSLNPDEERFLVRGLFCVVIDQYGEKMHLATQPHCANLALVTGLISFIYRLRYWKPRGGAGA